MSQAVIAYDDQDGRRHVYTTAYTAEQEREAIVRCVERYGRRANVWRASVFRRLVDVLRCWPGPTRPFGLFLEQRRTP